MEMLNHQIKHLLQKSVWDNRRQKRIHAREQFAREAAKNHT